MTAPGYHRVGELYRSERHVVDRGRREADGVPVLLKRPLRPQHRSAQLEAFRREFALLSELSSPGVPRALELVHREADVFLVLEDRGGEPLASLLASGPVGLSTFFPIALQLASILAELHRQDVIHNDVHPRSLVFHPETRDVWFADFGLASRGWGEGHAPGPGPLPLGALPYMSPERTGRMNRTTDYRSDFYSLGVTFYELLTGARPFPATDPLELVHAHIARVPESPSALRPEVPETLSQIVLKLLEKTAEARYQSARGLKADLEIAAREWSARRSVAPFALGREDVSDRFLIPQHLYGRDREVAQLTEAFGRASRGAASLMLVAGYSGVGKTSLIQEIYRPIVRQRGYFISGKFDQVVRNIPFGALIQAFRGLVQQLLTESEERLAVWRAELERALGENGGVLTEVIPEIALIMGVQPPAPALPAAETQNRFRLAFQNFTGALASTEHPLVVFLDDLQWADAASLGLLQPLLTGPDIQGLFLIGAYRDNEVDPGHLLSRTVASLEASGARVERIALGPLGLEDITRLVGDCLRRSDGDVLALARLVVAKTEGNPFFLRQFLETLWQDGLIAFDHERRGFTFRIDDIARAPMTDNVIDLMSRRIQRFSAPTQQLLTLAACVGNPFDVRTLAVVSRQSPDETVRGLGAALDEGLLVAVAAFESASPQAEDRPAGLSYGFLHDRVQQAAYARLPEESRRELHLTVGRLLLERWDRAADEEKLFEVVGHLNLGRSLVTDQPERLSLARLNLAAGQRAKASTAYDAALGHFKAGLELLPESAWSSDYELMFELQREAAEAESLCGHVEEAERWFGELLERARGAIDKAQVHALRLVQHESLSRFAEAASIGREGLRLFGVSFPEDEDGKRAALEAEIRTIEARLSGRSIASLVELPACAEPETRMVLKLLTDMWAGVYVSGDGALSSLISARIVALSVERGNTEDSAYGYVTHAISVGPLRGEYQAAYEWGQLALAVNQRFADRKRRAKIHQQFNAHVTLWRRPLETCIPHAQAAYRCGLQTGDFTYAGYGALTEAWAAFLISRDLCRFVRDFTPTLASLRKIRMTGLASAHAVLLNWANALRDLGDGAASEEGFDQAAFVASYGDNPFFMTIHHVAKLHVSFLLEDYPGALAAAEQARRLGPWGRGTIWPPLLEFWGALAQAWAPGDGSEDARISLRQTLVSARDAFSVLALNCPENFECFRLILTAEVMRLDRQTQEALDLYEEAIRYARRTESLQHEALASELSGRVWLERGNGTVGAVYLGEARRCYAEWGAAAKVRALEERHPWLPAARGEPAAPTLDVASVTKAARALSGEIVLEELLRKLMRIALENAGAERGFFLRERAGHLVIEAEGRVGSEAVNVLQSVPLENSSGLSRAVVQYVRKTGTSIVIGNAATDERFASDPYVRATPPRSVLCVPVVHQGRLGGILYLENNLAADAFTAERIEVLNILSSQAAISLESARLYGEMKQEVERRRLAEQALREALDEVRVLKDRLQAENVYLQEEIRTQHNFEEIVGTSPALLEALDRVDKVARTDATVLILGETGAGKELFARAVHSRGPRRDRPLVKVNCGAIAAGLVESELFGHVKGAFTGALQRRTGRFELADGGTIFLDEVGELPPDTQVKLLRVLQEKEFEPVGSSETRRVDVRVIAATNRDLEEAVRAGRFRADLLYRLNVFPVRVPPLRERRSDIPQLVGFFVSALSRRLGRPLEGFSRRDMERLTAYSWPGNIRELENVVETAAILARGPMLELERDLPGRTEAPASPGGGAGTLEEVERAHIVSVLKATGGVVEGPKGAARILGLNPNTLRSRMKKLAVEPRSRDIS